MVIAQLDDIFLGAWPGAGDMQSTEAHCVGMAGGGRHSSREYRIRARGSGNGGRFELSNGTDRIAFRLHYRDNVNSSNWVEVRRNSANRRFYATTMGKCNSGQTVQELRITIREQDMQDKTSGAYTGTLTITVEPQ